MDLHAHPRPREGGFTLVEVLVVCLVVALLAAIALPTFLRQQGKAQDADAKSNARNLVSHVEACHTSTEDYRDCATVADLGTTGLPLVDGTPTADATVGVSATALDGYTITARSRHESATFSIERTAGGDLVHHCTGTGGGCVGGTW